MLIYKFLTGVVLVHCLMGMSRSSTLVLAFLMLRRMMTVTEALKLVRTYMNMNMMDLLELISDKEIKRHSPK